MLEDKIKAFFERTYSDVLSDEELQRETSLANPRLIDLHIDDNGELRNPNSVLTSPASGEFLDLYRELFYSYDLLTSEEKRQPQDERKRSFLKQQRHFPMVCMSSLTALSR